MISGWGGFNSGGFSNQESRLVVTLLYVLGRPSLAGWPPGWLPMRGPLLETSQIVIIIMIIIIVIVSSSSSSSSSSSRSDNDITL